MTAGLSTHQRLALDHINEAFLLNKLAELVTLQSVADHETTAQEAVARIMTDIGLATDVWEIDFTELSAHPDYAADVERSQGLGVVGTYGEGRSGYPTLILNGHVDVVDAGDLSRWDYPAWKLSQEGDRLYGRGTVDMKGAVCCALTAIKAVIDSGLQLPGQVQIQSVIGEEDGGCGTLATLLRGHTGDGAVVLEPTLQTLAPAQAGALSFRLTVPGKAAHGALRSEGVDPIEKFFLLHKALRKLERRRNTDVLEPLFSTHPLPYALAIGKIRAGTWPSTVAESLTAEGRLGIAPDEDASSAQAELEQTVRQAAQGDPWLRDHPPTLEWIGAQFSGARTDPEDPLVRLLQEAVLSSSGSEAQLTGMPYGADMRLLSRQGGIPTVLYGPGDIRRAHRPNEFVQLSELLEVTRTLVVLALSYSKAR